MVLVNELGFLQPIEAIIVTLDDVIKFSDSLQSKERDNLSFNLRVLVDDLTKNTLHPFQIWISGSYASTKPNPKDIDLTVFLHPEDNKNLNEYIVEVYRNRERIMLHVDFKKFNLIQLSEDNEIAKNEIESLAINRRQNDEILVGVSGYFQINL